jgi:hypothetical protein
MLLTIDFLLLLLIASLVVAMLQLPTTTARLAGAFMVIAAILIISVEVLALLGCLTDGWAYSALHTLLIGFIPTIWIPSSSMILPYRKIPKSLHVSSVRWHLNISPSLLLWKGRFSH